MKKYIITVIGLVISVLVINSATVSASADNAGLWGDNIYWSISVEGTLTLSGTGETGDGYSAPWYLQRNSLTDKTLIDRPIKRIVIEEGINKIGDLAFWKLDIESVSFPNSLEHIGANAFTGCRNLKEVSLPENLKSLGERAFSGTKISEIVLPDSITHLRGDEFIENDYLETVEVLPTNPSFTYEDGILYNKDKTELLLWPSADDKEYITVPEGIKKIGKYAFYSSKIKGATLPDGLEIIDASAFAVCRMLESITFPESVDYIGDGAFIGCEKLTRIELPQISTIGQIVFSSCTNLASVVIPDSVTEIKKEAFSDCRRLTNITLSKNITKIGDKTFYNCIFLNEIIFPAELIQIGEYAFAGCSALKSVRLPEKVKYIGKNAFDGCVNVASISLPDSLEIIGEGAFQNCHVSKLIVPPDVKEIGKNAFYFFSEHEKILVMQGNSAMVLPEKSVSFYEDSVIFYCSSEEGKNRLKSLYPESKVHGYLPEEWKVAENSDPEDLSAVIPSYKITLNGQEIDSSYREYPMLNYRGITYFPMTYFDCRYLGLTTTWEDSKKQLQIKRENITASLHEYLQEEKNSSRYDIQICDFSIKVNGEYVFNATHEFPFIIFRNVTYFPLTWRFAVEEFGWEYSYTGEAGLVINSANYHTENLNLPNLAPPNETKEISVVQNGEYYYYTGSGKDESNFYIYRAPVENPMAYEELYTFPKKGHMGKEWLWFYFTVENDTVYMTYRKDPSHMGSYHHYKIAPDGSVEETYNDGSLYTETSSGGRGILKNIYDVGDETVSWINRVNYGENSGTAVSYTKDGIETEVSLHNVRFGLKKDGEKITSAYPQILDEKIYVTGWEQNTEENSSLYEINMNDGVITKIIDDVFDYYVSSNAIYYTCRNTLYRYDITDKSVAVIEENAENISMLSLKNGLMLASKKDNKVTITAYGESGNKKAIFETEFPTEFSNGAILNGIPREHLYAAVDGSQVNSDSNVRLAVFNNADTPFFSADAAESVFLQGDTLIYVTADTKKAIKVELGQ